MFKFKSKIKLVEKNDAISPREMVTNFLADDEKTNLTKMNQIIFKEIQNLKDKNDNNYINTNYKRFKHLLLSNQYVDFGYFALQIYLLQNDINGFKYWEIKKLLSKVIGILEDTLLEWKSISIANKIYITTSDDKKLTINNKIFPRINIQKQKPKGPIFSVENIKINLNGVREMAIYQLITKNFDDILMELLERTNQVLLGNILIMKIGFDYVVVPSGKFLFGHKITRNLSKTMEIVQLKNYDDNDKFVKSNLKADKAIYKTQQIFLGKKNKKIKKIKFAIKNKLLLGKKNIKLWKKADQKEPKTKLKSSHLKKEISDIISKIKKSKPKKEPLDKKGNND